MHRHLYEQPYSTHHALPGENRLSSIVKDTSKEPKTTKEK